MNPKATPKNTKPSAEFQAFDEGLRRALATPKEEIDRREKEWREKQQARKQKPPKH